VLRLSSEFDDEMCSIAIHVGGGKIMHLVYETLYVERIAGRMADEYRPRQVLFPDSSFTKVEMATGMGRHVFSMADGSKPTLARIAASVIRATPALAAAKVNMVEETIYMLNKDKFMLGRVYSSEDRCWEKGAILRQRADRLRMPIPWHVPEEW